MKKFNNDPAISLRIVQQFWNENADRQEDFAQFSAPTDFADPRPSIAINRAKN
ncbi:hypothetical protein DSM3645_05994 [Blastopirellula marina DSM 3645]|uniref:Uncharacterized protein n=1 Tax=Blastopirellula marina DSM 3645 TaxID=314230 RepID=A4A043_9BACT|nr:hypothetical protein DSM3645_05994 [Blastopirellula marina DSM 3645]